MASPLDAEFDALPAKSALDEEFDALPVDRAIVAPGGLSDERQGPTHDEVAPGGLSSLITGKKPERESSWSDRANKWLAEKTGIGQPGTVGDFLTGGPAMRTILGVTEPVRKPIASAVDKYVTTPVASMVAGGAGALDRALFGEHSPEVEAEIQRRLTQSIKPAVNPAMFVGGPIKSAAALTLTDPDVDPVMAAGGLGAGAFALKGLGAAAGPVVRKGGEVVDTVRDYVRNKSAGAAAEERAIQEALAQKNINSAQGAYRSSVQSAARDLEVLEREAAALERPPSEYLYHVTPESNVSSIRQQGLRPDAPKLAEGGPHGNTRAVFLADEASLPIYENLYSGGAEGLARFRVARNAVQELAEDTASEGNAFLTPRGIGPEHLEVFSGGKWVPVSRRTADEARAFLASPEGVALREQVARNKLQTAPERIGEMQSKLDEYQQLAANKDANVSLQTAEALRDPVRKHVVKRAMTLGNRYMPAALGTAGYAVAGVEGAAVGTGIGTVMSLTQGAPGRIIKNLIDKPAVRKAFWDRVLTASGGNTPEGFGIVRALEGAAAKGDDVFAVTVYILGQKQPLSQEILRKVAEQGAAEGELASAQ